MKSRMKIQVGWRGIELAFWQLSVLRRTFRPVRHRKSTMVETGQLHVVAITHVASRKRDKVMIIVTHL
jgi:hypothetical protein